MCVQLLLISQHFLHFFLSPHGFYYDSVILWYLERERMYRMLASECTYLLCDWRVGTQDASMCECVYMQSDWRVGTVKIGRKYMVIRPVLRLRDGSKPL